MKDTFWLKQAKEPLFSDLLWSRPVSKRSAGKLLIVGGNAHTFTAVNEAYGQAVKAGAGAVRLLLPDKLAKTLGSLIPDALYAPTTPSGSFASRALAEIIDLAGWSDGVLLAGEFGKNSETAILLEKFVQKYTGPLILSGDAVDYFSNGEICQRPDTTIVGSLAQLQKMAASAGYLLRQTDNLLALTQTLHEWTQETNAAIVTNGDGQVVVAYRGRVSTTPSAGGKYSLAGFTAVWHLQQPAKIFEALTSAVYVGLHEQ